MEWLDIEDVAKLLGVKVKAVYDLSSAGRIKKTKIGNRLKFRQSYVDEFIASRTSGGVPAPKPKQVPAPAPAPRRAIKIRSRMDHGLPR